MSEETKYFDLHTHGIGYLNRIRTVEPTRGEPFLATDITAIHGSTDALQKTRFDCRVVGAEAQLVIHAAMKHVEADRKVLVAFRIGDLYVDSFVYQNGTKAGETGFSLKARLFYVDWVKVDGRTVYSAQQPRTTAEAASASTETEAEPSTDVALPSEVTLTIDDPEFARKQVELKAKGYRFDVGHKVWRQSSVA